MYDPFVLTRQRRTVRNLARDVGINFAAAGLLRRTDSLWA